MALAVDRFAKPRVRRAIGGGAFLRQRGNKGRQWRQFFKTYSMNLNHPIPRQSRFHPGTAVTSAWPFPSTLNGIAGFVSGTSGEIGGTLNRVR